MTTMTEGIHFAELRQLSQSLLRPAKGNQADIERGFEVHADGYVVKPFQPLELTEFAEKFLNKPSQG